MEKLRKLDLPLQGIPPRAAVDGGSPSHGETPHDAHLHHPLPVFIPTKLHGPPMVDFAVDKGKLPTAHAW